MFLFEESTKFRVNHIQRLTPLFFFFFLADIDYRAEEGRAGQSRMKVIHSECGKGQIVK